MATRNTQPGGNPYNDDFSIPTTPKGKSDADRLKLLENKIGLLTTLLFKRSIKDPNGASNLYIRKSFPYDDTILEVDLINNSFFAPGTVVDVRYTRSSKINDDIYFTKRFRETCTNKGLFPRRMLFETIDLKRAANYTNMILRVAVMDLTNGGVIYLEEVIL